MSDENNEPQHSTNSSENTATDTAEEGGSFDASALETDFGMPAGSLSGATDKDTAMERVREHADKVLSAGLSAPQQTATGKESKPDDSGQKKAETKPDDAAGGNPELDALRARVEKAETKLAESEQAQQKRQEQQFEQRFVAEVDSWGSTKYGTSQSRSYDQRKALNELYNTVFTHAVGCTSTGQPVPTVEKVLRQVRAFSDKDNGSQSSQGGASGGSKTPLGSPGATRQQGGKDQPRSIHHALLGRN